ncbi:MAG: XRE family transcriptional regulator [Planctomycetota bacterium]
MKHIGRMIKELRLKKGWTLRRLAQEVNKTPAYLSIIENKKEHVNMPLLENIARALGVTISYFVSDESTEWKPLSPQQQSSKVGKDLIEELRVLINKHSGETKQPPQLRRIPLISYTAAGAPTSYESPYPVGYADEYIEVSSEIGDPHAFALRIKGDSMEPRFFNGDVVIICPSWQVKENKPVVIKFNDDEVTCKIFSRFGDTVILSSLNPRHVPRICKQEDIIWIYPVVQVISNLY